MALLTGHASNLHLGVAKRSQTPASLVPVHAPQSHRTNGTCHSVVSVSHEHKLNVSSQRRRVVSNAFVPVPHAGYHFDGSSRRFFEGWYWKVTDELTGDSFALIYSVEDPGGKGAAQHAGVGVQVMGPDGYVCQFSRNTQNFWADPHELALGATLRPKLNVIPRNMLSETEFDRCVEQGFQASAVLQQGAIIANEQGAGGASLSTQPNCSWCLNITPITGWGAPSATSQRATAGWLSALQVFEPHWQVLMSHGLASGWVQWGERRYEFTNAPSYAEKNWGGGFPSKWHWLQCNTWQGQPGMSVTAVGARRALLLGIEGTGLGEEDVGLIGVTLPSGEFIELVPWTAELEWDVDPWGRWWIKGVGDEYEVVVEGKCTDAGVVLRAPTITQGLTPFCKDSFYGQARLRVWRRTKGAGAAGRSPTPFVDATSTSAAVEVGGGPWWSAWSAQAAMREPFRTLVTLPIDVGSVKQLVPPFLRPPGL